MKFVYKNFKYSFFFIALVFFFSFVGYIFSGTNDNFAGYGWGSSWVDLNSNSVQNLPDETAGGIGWVSFNCVNDSATCNEGNNYGVKIETNGDVSGYAWSPNYGWLKFGGLSGFPTGASAPSSNWYNSSWTKRVKITVQASKVSGTVTNFPVYVNLANLPAAFHTNVNQTDARDIRVTSADGTTELAREVVFYNSTSDTGELHFKAPSLSSASNTDFYIYYGNPSATDYAVSATYGRNNVWTNYLFVSHGQTNATDSKSGLTGTITGAINSPAILNRGYDFAGGTTTDNISYGDNLDFNYTDSFSISAWVNSSNAARYSSIVTKGLPNSPYSGWFFYKQDAAGGHTLALDFISTITGSNWIRSKGSISIGDAINHYVVTTYDGSGVYTGAKFYVDNNINTTSQFGAGALTGGTLTSANLVIGNRDTPATNNQAFDGLIDEVRIKTGVTSANWITTEYNNQNNSATFYTNGTEETYSSGGGGSSGTNAKFTGTNTSGVYNGTLSGWARFCSPASSPDSCSGFFQNDQNGGWDGWLSLSGTSPNYGVSITNNVLSGYAWGGNDNNKNFVGWLDMSGINIQNNQSVLDFYASPYLVAGPTFVTTLNWRSTNQTVFTSCIADSASPLNPASVPGWSGSVSFASPSSLQVSVPYNTTKYKITCTDNLSNVYTSTISVSRNLNENLTLTNTRVVGGLTTLSWKATNIQPDSCVASTANPSSGLNWSTVNPKTPPTVSDTNSTVFGSMTNVVVNTPPPNKTTYFLTCIGKYSLQSIFTSLDLNTSSGASLSGVPIYREN